MKFYNEADIINQSKFRELCFRNIHKLPFRMKDEQWTKIDAAKINPARPRVHSVLLFCGIAVLIFGCDLLLSNVEYPFAGLFARNNFIDFAQR